MSVPTFVTTESFAAGRQVTLGEDAAHHIRVRRLDVGAAVALLDGQGSRGTGTLVRIAKRNATVEVESVAAEPPPRAVHLLVPVADKDRMLWLAEKTAELGASSWRPVLFRRSRSVSPRGEGPMFTQKVTARMVAALEQSGSAWLPAIFPDASVERAIAASPPGPRFVLDGAGDPLVSVVVEALARAQDTVAHPDATGAHRAPDELTGAPVTVAVGPEGGIESDEHQLLRDAGFIPASIGANILRFETAAVAALGVVQSAFAAHSARAAQAASAIEGTRA